MAEPRFLVLIENLATVRDFGGTGWSWRCAQPGSRLDPGYVDGACQYDHTVDTREELVTAVVEHLRRWHGLLPADSDASDSNRYPWAQDFNGYWHKRPPGKPWFVRNDGPQCETVCLIWIPSVHTSQYRPEKQPGRTAPKLCRICKKED